MNEIRVAELIQLNSDYYAGQSKNILYRCNLIGPFVCSICDKKEVETLTNLLIEWFDLCDFFNIDLVESLIEFYTYGTFQNHNLSIYDMFPEYIERLVDFLLGKEHWSPPSDLHEVAEDYSNDLTAQILIDIYSK